MPSRSSPSASCGLSGILDPSSRSVSVSKEGSGPRSVLVLCEGNHCRSPMAEGLLRAGLHPGIQVASAGLGARDGFAPHAEAIRLMAAQGVDITRYRSRQVTPAMALAADLILVMEQVHKDWCEALLPSTRGRVFLLGCWLPAGQQDITDPFRQPRETFALVFEAIRHSVTAWQKRLNALRRTP